MDIPRLIRAILNKPEPQRAPVSVYKEPVPSMDNIRAMIAALGKGKTDAEQCQLWYELDLMAFNELGEVMVSTYALTPEQVRTNVLAQYPGLADLKCPDGEYWCTDLAGLQKILTRDWTNIVPYVLDKSDCDKFANRLFEHCCRYYAINTVFPVWGQTTQGYHAFNCAVVWDISGYQAYLIEPQADTIFKTDGPLGHYQPDTASQQLGNMK